MVGSGDWAGKNRDAVKCLRESSFFFMISGMTTWKWKSFAELDTRELYALLRLRAEVFVVEQICPYLDPDGFDQSA
jgi:hypothetical protein